MEPDPQILAELVRRIVEVAHPVRILLFGSAARGEMRPDSDLDVLVIVNSEPVDWASYGSISRSLAKLGVSVDVILASETDLKRFGDNWSLVYYWALREGREIYVA